MPLVCGFSDNTLFYYLCGVYTKHDLLRVPPLTIAADRDTFLIFQVKIRDIASPCNQIKFGVLGHD